MPTLDIGGQAQLVDNRAWIENVTALEFLRDVGKLVTVNTMLAKESIKSRLDGEQGISYTEFSYMLLQANDFVALHERNGCELQVGGSDQWGNITAGIDMIRRKTGAHAHGLTVPLVTRPMAPSSGRPPMVPCGSAPSGRCPTSSISTGCARTIEMWSGSCCR